MPEVSQTVKSTSTTSETYDRVLPGTYGTYGYLTTSTLDIPESLDDDWGLKFVKPVAAETVEPPKPEVDTRTEEDLNREARALIANSIDLPREILDKCGDRIQEEIDTIRDYLLLTVVPVALAMEPALTSVRMAVPEVLGDPTLEVDIGASSLQSFARTAALLAAQEFVIARLNLPDAIRQRLYQRMLPEAKNGK